MQVTLMGLWLVPMVISVYAIWWRFVLVSCICKSTVQMYACQNSQSGLHVMLQPVESLAETLAQATCLRNFEKFTYLKLHI